MVGWRDNKNSRITSADARRYRASGIIQLEMHVCDPPEKIVEREIADLTPPNETLKNLAKKHPAPQEWYDADHDYSTARNC